MRHFFLCVAACLLASCETLFGVGAARLDTANKNLAAAAIELESLADLATDLVESGVISTDHARAVSKVLRVALNGVKEAQTAIEISGDPMLADGALERAQSAAKIAIQLLTAFTPAANDAAFIPERKNTWEFSPLRSPRKSPAF